MKSRTMTVTVCTAMTAFAALATSVPLPAQDGPENSSYTHSPTFTGIAVT
jgi:hypothetical protein